MKRTASLISLSNTELPNLSLDQTMNNGLFSPPIIFKGRPQRRLQHIQRHQQQNNKNDIEQTNNTSPPIITMPHLMEFTRRLSRSSSNNDNDTTVIDTQIDSNPVRPSPKNETSILRTKMPIVINNNGGHLKRILSQKLTNYAVQKPLSPIESIFKERSISITQETTHQQLNTVRQVNQIFKKQIFLPFEKK